MTGFNRERFLLRLVAGVLLGQLTLYGLAAASCSWRFTYGHPPLPQGTCLPVMEGLNRSVEVALQVLLALMGAGAMAAGAIKGSPGESSKPNPPEKDDPRY